jgi:ATP-dependent Clp protease protease subunit
VSVAPSLAEQNPGGCYFAFNGMIDRKNVEQLVSMCSDARNAGFREVTLCLSSLGGFLVDAYYAFNMLEALPLRLITYNMSTVQSAANMLFLCGDERYACPGSTWFFHQTAFNETAAQRVTEAYAKEKLRAIQLDDARTAEIIANKTTQPVERVREWQNTEVLMSTDDAIAHGILHEVRPLAIPDNALFRQIILQG